jgi:DNA-binding response OmpR family regulator
MRVLVADDDRELAACIAEFVRLAGHEPVATVTNGGLAVLEAYDRTRPDVVLMDVMMPKVNGLTVSHALASRAVSPKVIFLSGKVDSAHPFIMNARADAFLAKPVTLEQLRAVMDELEAQVA